MSKVPPVNRSVWRSPVRRRSEVIRDFFNRNISLDRRTAGYLAWYPSDQYDAVLRMVGRIKPLKLFQHLMMDPPEKVFSINFDELPKSFLIQYIDDTARVPTLDLRSLKFKHNRWVKDRGDREGSLQLALSFPSAGEGAVGKLVDVIGEERTIFQRLARDTATSIDEIFKAIDRGKVKLGFLNVGVYRPLPDGKWIRTRRTRHWTHGLSKYDAAKGGDLPGTTIQSVIEGDRTIYEVNINDLSTFARAGLIPDTESIRNDLDHSKGPGQMLFIKLVSTRWVEGVVHLHNRVRKDEAMDPPPLLPGNLKDAKRVITELEIYFEEAARAIEAVRQRESIMAGFERIARPYVPVSPKDEPSLLTGNHLFNPAAGVAYPRTAAEYDQLISRLVDGGGRFPGDTETLTRQGTFTPKQKGVSHLPLKRKGRRFQVEVLSPKLNAQGVKNRLIFDADLLAQGASYDAYGTAGVSYDTENYYVRRLFNAEKVIFIRFDGWPVSFAAMQGYQMSYEGRELYYAFIHFVMTRGAFQGYGLTSYAIREGISSLLYTDAWRNRPNLMIDDKGQLKDYRFRMWVAAHSGRFTPFYAFARGFAGIDPAWDPIAQAIFRDVHKRITPPEELVDRPQPVERGAVQVNGGKFPLALDEGVYPLHTRYPVKNGVVEFPVSEADLHSSMQEVWLREIGGQEGVAAGNGLYFGGIVNLGRIREAKKKEKQRERKGGNLERTGDKVRSWFIKREK